MKTTDKIPLNEVREVSDGDGGTVTVPVTRTVAEEIARLEHLGALEAAQRLRDSCEDTPTDGGKYVEVDPTSKGKDYAARQHKFADAAKK